MNQLYFEEVYSNQAWSAEIHTLIQLLVQVSDCQDEVDQVFPLEEVKVKSSSDHD